MIGNSLLLFPAVLPMLAAPVAYALGRRREGDAVRVMIAASLAALVSLVWLALQAARGVANTLVWDGFCGMGLRMRADGFRTLYAGIAGVMWLVTSVFSRDYFRHEHNVERYAVFVLLTLGATAGLFLSDTLYSAFLFFEVMSLASYPWVAQEETPDAMRAAQTYLYIAVIGGLVMLMGLFLLPGGMACAPFEALPAVAQTVGADALWLPALLVLFGFGAKAGAFPLHIWLPKAHPVAPAPASALLSGMLTKAGVFGMLVLTCYLMRGCERFGDLIFRLGVITMFLGALLAIFSTNLKRTLACSSLSQIGFIMVGVGVLGLSRSENGLAAYGVLQHMMNHSLFKLTLFLCAGVVAMNAHALALDDVRGYGRRKPLLHFCFLMGVLGISGIPLFSGYASKTLLHEGLLEYIAERAAEGLSVNAYAVGETLFVISGGMTLCYMLKLYVCLFWQKHPTRQAEFDAQRQYLSAPSAVALALCAALIPLMGSLPNLIMTPAAELARPFFGAPAPRHLPIAYFSGENLLGALKSILVGAALFALNRFCLMEKDADGSLRYPQRWPKWLDLEDGVYRPLMNLLIAVGYGVAYVLDCAMDWAVYLLKGVGLVTAKLLDGTGDWAMLLTRKTALAPSRPHMPVPVGNRFTFTVGRAFDGVVALLNRTVRRGKPITTSFVSAFAAGQEELGVQFKRLTRSISFGLLMFCAGLYVTLAYLLWF